MAEDPSHDFFPVLFFAAGVFYLLFVEDYYIKVAVIILINFLLWLYFNEQLKQTQALAVPVLDKQRELLLLLEVMMVFFISSGLFGLGDFINLPLVYLIIIYIILMFIVVNYFVFYLEKLNINKLLYSLILTLVMAELFIAITIFPLLYYLKGIIISLGYLLVIKLALASQTVKIWSKKTVYLIVAITATLAMILLSSRWF